MSMFFKFNRFTRGSFGSQFHDKSPVLTKAATNSFFGQNFNLNRFNTTEDDLTSDSVLEQWLPSTPVLMHKLFRIIHRFDSVAGPAVDLISIMPFSEVTLVGINDKKILDVYEESIQELHLQTLLPDIASEFLVIGRVIGSLLFDSIRGIWTDIIIQDPDFCEITNIPLRGHDPKIDLKVSEDLKDFLRSKDPRDLEAKKDIPKDLADQLLQHAMIPLDPASTLYLPRQTTPYDFMGSSIYNRILPFFALEKTLVNGTLIGAKRRQRSILHVTVGESDLWEPDEEDISTIARMFMQADEDPQGAIVATRMGVETNEVRAGSDFWKISDEWDFLSNAKMRALGINESFLSGDATYNTMEVALSVFVEMLRNFRDNLVSRIFYEKLFPTLAVIHGFKKRSQAELAHRIRIEGAPVDSSLIIPQINFHKQLRPEADSAYLDVLSTMEEKGIPIPLRTWASAGGLSLERIMDMKDEDLKNRAETKKWLKVVKSEENENEGEEESSGNTWGSTQAQDSIKTALDSLPIWLQEKFVGIKKSTFASILKSTDPAKKLVARFKDSPKKAAIGNYVLHRLGISSIPFDVSSMRDIALHLKKCTSRFSNQRITNEFTLLNKMVRASAPDSGTSQRTDQWDKQFPLVVDKKLYSGTGFSSAK